MSFPLFEGQICLQKLMENGYNQHWTEQQNTLNAQRGVLMASDSAQFFQSYRRLEYKFGIQFDHGITQSCRATCSSFCSKRPIFVCLTTCCLPICAQHLELNMDLVHPRIQAQFQSSLHCIEVFFTSCIHQLMTSLCLWWFLKDAMWHKTEELR